MNVFVKNDLLNLNNLKKVQAESLKTKPDEYTAGFYNGLECAISMLEHRKAEYICVTKEPETKENAEEQKGRTIASGIIRRR